MNSTNRATADGAERPVSSTVACLSRSSSCGNIRHVNPDILFASECIHCPHSSAIERPTASGNAPSRMMRA